MLKVIGINLILDAIIFILCVLKDAKSDQQVPLSGLFLVWLIWCTLLGFVTIGITLLFM